MVAKRIPKGTLSRGVIVEAALRLADRETLDAVTVRAVAKEMGASPMALYAHFADKDALLDAMRSALAERAYKLEGISSWPRALEALADGIVRLARSHPRWMPLAMRPARPSEAAIETFNHLLDLMTADGFTLVNAMEAYCAVVSYGIGFAMIERTTMEVAKRWALVSPTLPRLEKYAKITTLARELDRWSADEALQFGVRSVVEELRRRHRRSP